MELVLVGTGPTDGKPQRVSTSTVFIQSAAILAVSNVFVTRFSLTSLRTRYCFGPRYGCRQGLVFGGRLCRQRGSGSSHRHLPPK